MSDQPGLPTPRAFLRLQSWLSPAFPVGAYSYSHGLEYAVEAGYVRDGESLIDWLEADLRYGSGRNEAIFFNEAWRRAAEDNRAELLKIVALAAAFRGTAEFALEASQQGTACLMMLARVWSDPTLVWLAAMLHERNMRPTMAVILGVGSAREALPMALSLPAFLQGYIANLVTAGVRLIPLGQTDAQIAIAALEETVLLASEDAMSWTIDDLGSAGFMVELASMAHETQYTRLFRS